MLHCKKLIFSCLSIFLQMACGLLINEGVQFSLSSYGSQNCTNSQYATGSYSGLCTNTPSGSVNVTCAVNGSWILTEYTLSNCNGAHSTIQGSDGSCTANNSSSYFVQCLIPPYILLPSNAEFGISSLTASSTSLQRKANYSCQTHGTTNASYNSIGSMRLSSRCNDANLDYSNYLQCDLT